jgi:XTP/dITP diphosphohydrolase/tetrapyrrole methylase family protein/MazG family protein
MSAMDDLRETIARLRAPGGCPWDQEQTHASLVRCLIDEVSELIETIDRMDFPHMREELGDVLIQVIFHAQLAAEAGHFTLEEVAREVNEKLVRRHPHVFGDATKLGTSGEVIETWETIKERETAQAGAPESASAFKTLPPRLPALMFAEAVWKQVTKADLPVAGVAERSRITALASGLDDAALGERLFELAAAARERGLDPEGALRRRSERVMQEVDARVRAQQIR